MFGRPKKVKELGKPASAEESIAVKKALKEKYPDMVNKTGAWGKPKKKTETSKSSANRTNDVSKQLANSGLTEAEIKKLRGS